MREYIHFFEDSSQRDAYEYGNDYTEPYVSYTPVINEYKAQFNGNNDDNLIIKKQRGEYLISSSNELITVISLTTGTIPKISNDLFYAIYVRENAQSRFFVIEEDLELTDLSTEVTVHRGKGEGTLYIVNSDENVWKVYEDSEHTSRIGTLIKFDIVSTPSSSNTDSVHYNNNKEIQLYEITSYVEFNGDQGCAIYLDKPITEEYSNPIVCVYSKTTGELVGTITPNEISYNETETIIRVNSKPYGSLVVFKYTRQDGTVVTTNKYETGLPQIVR